ncbi:MAG: hypothetical protein ABI421_09735 [Polyangiaceae bacterium]
MNSKSAWLACLLLSTACGSTQTSGTTTDGGAGEDGSVSDAGSKDAAPVELDGGVCPDSFTAFKSCTTASECAIENEGNCCGDPEYIGIAGLAVTDYQRCFPTPSCAGLGCATGVDCRAEDGNTASCQFNTDALAVACNAGQCETYIQSVDGGDGG